MSTVTGDLTVVVSDQGGYVEVTTIDLDMSGYSADSVFVLETAPTKGSLYIGSTLLAADDTYTREQYIISKLYYRHAGADAVADSFGIIARDDPSGTPSDSAESTVNITVTAANLGWALYSVPNSNPPTIVSFSATKYLLDQAVLVWDAMHWGDATVVVVTDAEVVTFLGLLITKDDERHLDTFPTDGRDKISASVAAGLSSSLVSELDKAAYASVKTLVMTHGSDIDQSTTVWNSLTATEQSNWVKIKTEINVSETKRVEVPNSDWYGAVDLTRVVLISV
jgi:hypothetical protein